MKSVYHHSYNISAGDTNAENELSLPVLVSKMIDIATIHANSLNIGNPCMTDKNAGWVLARLSIEMITYPHVNEQYVLSTWIESFNRHLSVRCFKIENSRGEVLGYGRSIWVVINIDTHENIGLEHLSLSPELIEGNDVPIARQGRHPNINELQASAPSKTEKTNHYTFNYTDLDFYRHVSTVKYISLLLNQFTLKEHDETSVKRMELSFSNESRYETKARIIRIDDPITETLDSHLYIMNEHTNEIVLYSKIIRKRR